MSDENNTTNVEEKMAQAKNKNNKGKLKGWASNNYLQIVGIFSVLGIGFSFLAPSIFTGPGYPDFRNTSPIADTINGLMSPFIAIVAAFLTFSAFYIQFKANKLQIEEIKKQDYRNREERFETNLIDLLKMHRENVNEIRITLQHRQSNDETLSGYEAIRRFCEVFNDAMKQLWEKLPESERNDIKLKKEYTVNMYLFFYFGKNRIPTEYVKAKFRQYIDVNIMSKIMNISIDSSYAVYLVAKDGYGHIFSRYFRHLLQIAKFIEERIPLELKDEKYRFGKMLRSTLTCEEQTLLFYNALSPLGKTWHEQKYIFDLKLIKNIPVYMIYGYRPTQWFMDVYDVPQENLKDYFEYEEL